MPEKRLIPGEGPLDAPICFIGEAPGADEDRMGRPFVGRAGRLFDDLLRRAGIARTACRITNVVKERPPNNDISIFINLEKKGNAGTPAFWEHVGLLKKELQQCTANVFVPLGNVPLFTLTGRKGITKWRGSILESTLLPGKKVIPTIHPSAALREYLFEHYIVHDLRRIVEQAKFPEVRTPQRNLILKPSFLDTMAFLRYIKEKCKSVGFDIEVLNNNVSCISFATSPHECICIPFLSKGDPYFDPDQEVEIWHAITGILEDPSITKIGHNVIFDATFLFQKFGIRTKPLHCTMIAQAILHPDFPKGLDFVTSTWTDEPYYKDDGKKYFKSPDNDMSFWRYNALDSAVCLEAFPKQMYDLQRMDNVQTYMRQSALIEPLMYMQVRGIRVDVENMRRESEEAEKKIHALTEELKSICGFDINPNSPAQLKTYFYDVKGLPPYTNRKTGAVSTDVEALKRLSRKGIREARLVLDIRKLTKLRGTYYEVTLDKDNRLRGAMNPVGTKTGRLSSSKTIFDTGGNMQNQPPQMKRMMIADEGCLLIACDKSQAENRIVAYIAPEPSMIAAFEEGRDIHSQTAGLIFGKPFDQVSREEGSCPLGNGEDSERGWGKKANHSLNYDLSPRAFSLIFEMPEAEAKFIWERYHTVYPGIRQQYHRWVRESLSRDRTLINPFGRRRLFLDRWGDDLFKEAYAFIPQSTVADLINEWGLLYVYNNQEIFRDIEILNQVHDSLELQVPIKCGFAYIANACISLQESLNQPIEWRSTSFVIPTDFKIGFNLEDMEKVKITTPDETAQALEDAYKSLLNRKG